jgi:hypothetical protein
MRMGLPHDVVLVEVPRPKAHCVEPVLLAMAVSGHKLGVGSSLNCLARHAAPKRIGTPGDNVEQASGHGPKSVREDATEPPSHLALGRSGVATSALIELPVPRRGLGVVEIGPLVTGRSGDRDRPAGCILRLLVGESARCCAVQLTRSSCDADFT